jgi:hypothetical protein
MASRSLFVHREREPRPVETSAFTHRVLLTAYRCEELAMVVSRSTDRAGES